MKKELDYRSAFRHGSQQARSWSISRESHIGKRYAVRQVLSV